MGSLFGFCLCFGTLLIDMVNDHEKIFEFRTQYFHGMSSFFSKKSLKKVSVSGTDVQSIYFIIFVSRYLLVLSIYLL